MFTCRLSHLHVSDGCVSFTPPADIYDTLSSNRFCSCVFRQLEAVVRIAESLAKMKLQAVAGEEEVDEALRLFQVSTLDAALSGSLSGVWCCAVFVTGAM